MEKSEGSTGRLAQVDPDDSQFWVDVHPTPVIHNSEEVV